MPQPVIVSGMQPTGSLHIGNYLGALKNWVELQNSGKYELFLFVADLHSLTINMEPEVRRKNIKLLAAEYIAAGIDPNKTTLFVQSHVPEHAELAWIFNCVTPVGELKRMTQFKDKSGSSEIDRLWEKFKKEVVEEFKNPSQKILGTIEQKLQEVYVAIEKFREKIENKANAGLLTYPILQAADVLLYHGALVPVGQDQVQHLELTRDIARWFNKRYGNYFPETKPLLTPFPKVMSLLEPTKKMSKSAGEAHYIGMADEPDVIGKKLAKAVTATSGGGKSPGAENLLLLLKQFGDGATHQKFAAAEKAGTIRYSELKAALAGALGNYFADFRSRRAALLKNPGQIEATLEAGAKRARTVAEPTMAEVRRLVGIR